MFQLFSHINNCSSVFNSSLWPWFWLQPVQHWFLVGWHKLTVTFSCIRCNAEFWSNIYVLTSQRFMWPDAFNLSSPVLGLGRIIIINMWYLLLFLIFVVSLNRELASEVSPNRRFRRYITSSFWLDYFGCFGFNLVTLNFSCREHFSFRCSY